MRLTRRFLLLAATLLLATMVGDSASRAFAPAPLPNPVLVFSAPEFFTSSGKEFIRYHFFVDNYATYPDAMFAPAPALPPCGQNTKSSRTWIDFYDQRGKRLYGFCAFGKAADLNKLWFALPADEVPPSWVYIEMTDRETSTKYKSNLQDTTQ